MDGTAMAASASRESAALQALLADVGSIHGMGSALKEEIVLFQRTMYKNHSQHRRADFFHHLQEVDTTSMPGTSVCLLTVCHFVSAQVKRCLRDITVNDTLAMFEDAGAVLQQLQLQPTDHHISWKALAGELKIHTDAILRRLAKFAQNVAKVSPPD
jgi:hypothetical protein